MKTVLRLMFCVCFVVPLSGLAQTQSPAGPTCHAAFSANVTSTCNPSLFVHFTDESDAGSGDHITNWTWIFGDGRTSNDSNPDHIFDIPGVYSVKLIIKTNSGKTDSLTRDHYIAVGPKVRLSCDTAMCESGTLELDAENPGYGTTYLWSTGETSRKITIHGPGKYWVRVNRGSCEDSDTIDVKTTPELLTNFGFSMQGNCLPVNVQFTDSSRVCPGNTIVQWKWEFGDGQTSTQQHPTHTYTSSDSFVVRLTVWDNNGFSMTRSKRVVVSANQGPVVDLGPSDTTICELSGLVLDAGNPDASFTWSTGDIFQSCVITNSGQVWVRVDVNGCIATDTINVTVIPTLVANFGFVAQQGTCPVQVNFVDSSATCGSTVFIWQWDFGDGATSDEQHPAHTYTAAGEYTVTLTVYDNYGFVNTVSRQVSVRGSIEVNLGKDSSICFGDVLILDAGHPGASYQWSTGETTQEIMVMDDGKYWVRVDDGACGGADTIQVKTVFPVTPNFDFSINGSCLPVPVQFTDKSLENCVQKIIQWKWDFGDGTTSNEKNPLHAYNRSDSFAVRLTVTTDGGITVSKNKKLFIPNTVPVVFAGNDQTICKGDVAQLDAGVEGATYAWAPEGSLSDPNNRRPLANPFETTTYTVSVTKCGATVTDQVVVYVNGIEKPIINEDREKLTTGKAATYQWYKNGQLMHGAKDRTIQPRGAGQYSVKVQTANGCTAESDVYNYIPKGIKDKWVKGIRVKVAPNPTHGMVWVLLSQLPQKPAALTVVDRYGQRLYTTTIRNYSNMLNLHRLARGYYHIEVIIDGEKITIPLVIH